MTAVICVEDRGGVLFLGRRVSRDIEVIRDISRICSRILVTEYSRALFDGIEIDAVVCRSLFKEAKSTDTLFVENGEIRENLAKITRLIIYKWNRTYPSDVKLGFCPEDEGLKLTSTVDFPGKSHEKITREVYER